MGLLGGAPRSLRGFAIGANVRTDGTPGDGMALETRKHAAVAFDTIAGMRTGMRHHDAMASSEIIQIGIGESTIVLLPS